MNLNIRVEVRVVTNVDGADDERTENRIPILCHARSRRNNYTDQMTLKLLLLVVLNSATDQSEVIKIVSLHILHLCLELMYVLFSDDGCNFPE